MNNCHVHYATEIGEGTTIAYGGVAVVIHKNATIGKNCVIESNVTIGGRNNIPAAPVIGDNVFIGTGARILGDKVITYAASCGATKYQELPQSVADKIRSSFDRVSAFSVRDNNTHRFVENLTSKTVVDSLDPVLIYNFDKEVEAAILPELPAHYCVVYSYYNRIHTKVEIEAGVL